LAAAFLYANPLFAAEIASTSPDSALLLDTATTSIATSSNELIATSSLATTTPPKEEPEVPSVPSKLKLTHLINGVNDYKIMLSWRTNLPADSVLFYRRVGTEKYLLMINNKEETFHKIETPKLPAGDYEYYVRSRNAEGQEIRSQRLFSAATAFTAKYDPTGGQTLAIKKIEAIPTPIKDAKMYERLKGKIILRVEKKGEAYWVNPGKQEMYYLGRPDDAFAIMRQKGIGIANRDLVKIAVSLRIQSSGNDTDFDGLSDLLEDALATDKNKKDSDGDTHEDKQEVSSGFDPLRGGGAKQPLDQAFSAKQSGKIFIATERHGEAWYIDPATKKRVFLGRPHDAFAAMRGLGVGISEKDFVRL
jgi:hypothetical protein